MYAVKSFLRVLDKTLFSSPNIYIFFMGVYATLVTILFFSGYALAGFIGAIILGVNAKLLYEHFR